MLTSGKGLGDKLVIFLSSRSSFTSALASFPFLRDLVLLETNDVSLL